MNTLEKAAQIIAGERQDQYGNPEDSFQIIANYWTDYINSLTRQPENEFNIYIEDVAIMLALMKIARMSGQKWHKDNAVDACGYLAILNDRIKE